MKRESGKEEGRERGTLRPEGERRSVKVLVPHVMIAGRKNILWLSVAKR